MEIKNKSEKRILVKISISTLILVVILIFLNIVCMCFILIRKNKIETLIETSASEEKDKEEKNYEIERKWLVDVNKLPFNLEKTNKSSIEQSYICFNPEIRVRKINNAFMLTIKANMSANGLQREEYEYILSEKEYEKLYEKRDTSAKTISKTRYDRVEDEVLYHIDVYNNELGGLATVEVEGPKQGTKFESQEEANNFQPASWVGKEVTEDARYKNGNLAQNGIPK